jgi:hypothetical protein
MPTGPYKVEEEEEEEPPDDGFCINRNICRGLVK